MTSDDENLKLSEHEKDLLVEKILEEIVTEDLMLLDLDQNPAQPSVQEDENAGQIIARGFVKKSIIPDLEKIYDKFSSSMNPYAGNTEGNTSEGGI